MLHELKSGVMGLHLDLKKDTRQYLLTPCAVAQCFVFA